MNVYDFDGTVYAGDSSADFYRWLLRRYPAMLRSLPRQSLAAIQYYILRKGSKTEMKTVFFSAFRYASISEVLLSEFWDSHGKKLCSWYLQQKREDDVIISASPEFLLRPAMDMLGLSALLGSRVDVHSGAFDGLNCHGEEKVRRFRETYGEAAVAAFYSDRLSDAPMARLAERAYLVKNKNPQSATLTPWP